MTASGTWAVFSAYRPTPSLVDAVAAVQTQVDGVVVIDDGSGPAAADVLDALRARGVQVEALTQNRGIAVALNRGIAQAMDAGAERVVTFDQDSHASDGFIAALEAAADRAAAAGVRVGAVVPEYFAQVRQARGPAQAAYSDASEVIQSGMLIPVDTIRSAGPLREDFFIDLVDTEFELRLRRAGLRVLAAHSVRLEHALGAAYRRELFGRPVRLPGIPPVLTLSTPFRYFYRVRNRCVLTREYFRIAPGTVARAVLFDLIHFADVLRVARPRRSMWRIQRAGLSAALRGRMGAMPAALAPLAAEVHWSAPRIDEEDRR